MTKKRIMTSAAALLLVLVMFCAGGCGVDLGKDTEKKKKPDKDTEKTEEIDTSSESYGVFVGVDQYSFRIEDFNEYDLVVVDAQELRREQLAQLHSEGHKVYSYLNVGSLEKSRDYFEDYDYYCLDRYDNWPDEYWMDVTEEEWTDFVSETLPEQIRKKDPHIDGLFLDNLDVYSHIKDNGEYRDMAEDAYEALADVLERYREAGLPVLINGADEFVSGLIREKRQDLIQGVNQETVFSMIEDYDLDIFGAHPEAERTYYTDYLKRCKKAGLEVFLLEYTTDKELEEEIEQYCLDNDFRYYISRHVSLIPSGD